jgi:hypothetical protein
MTDSQRRHELEERRRQRQAEQKLQVRLELIRPLTDLLDRQQASYRVLYETDRYYQWIAHHFPATGELGRIDWSSVPNNEHLKESSEAHTSLWLNHIAEKVGNGDEEVVVLWSNGLYPALQVCFADLANNPSVLDSGFEVWAVSESGGWLVEYTAEDGWHWGQSVRVPC